jgi:hypothetical protein
MGTGDAGFQSALTRSSGRVDESQPAREVPVLTDGPLRDLEPLEPLPWPVIATRGARDRLVTAFSDHIRIDRGFLDQLATMLVGKVPSRDMI